MSSRRPLAIAIAVLLAAPGCGGDHAPGPKPAAPPRAETKPEATPKSDPPVVAKAVEPPAKPEPTLRIEPTSASLAAGDPGIQLLVEGRGAQGGVRDATREVAWSVEPEGVAAVGPDGYVRPLGAGKARVVAALGSERVEAEVTVAAAGGRAWDFAADVVPIFTRFGCNAGGCHGRADGQNGFHLSLFGYDPEGDYQALTRQASGRRLNLFAPESSLLIGKATGRTPHGGGLRLPPGSDAYRTLVEWIADGAPERRGETHGALADVRIEPPASRLDGPGPRQLRVIARYEDGHERDVTRMATYRSNDDSAVAVDEAGHAVLRRRAESDVVVRYQSHVLSTRISTPINPDLRFDFAKLPRRNEVDEQLFRRLEALKVPPSPPADDASFLRRLTLDLTGQLPLPEDIKSYVSDADPDKRAKKVDEVMRRPEFLYFWRLKLGDMLQISQARFGNGYGPYENWLNRRLEENAPWDKMVRELLTSLGNPLDFREGGPVNYALDGAGDPKVQAETTAQRFLGLRLRCAQCHNHPFDVWTQDDYFGLAAIFARVGPGGPGPEGGMMGRPEVKINPEGKIEHLRTKAPATPRLLDGTPVEVASEEDPRKVLADWMTSADNPYFAREMANWTWAQFFGKGIADPPDDLSAANPPVHPELLDALAKHFVEHGYDLRDLVRTIATSEAYALSSASVPGNGGDMRLFSHHLPRPLTAHQMTDAIRQATNVPIRLPNRSVRSNPKAVEIFDPSTPNAMLDTFGRCPRTNGCSPVSTPPLSLRQALLLIGSGEVDNRVSHLNGYLSALLDQDVPPPPGDLVEFLYYRTLCRPPSAEERSHWTSELEAAGSLREAAEDLFWALLNSREFAFNH